MAHLSPETLQLILDGRIVGAQLRAAIDHLGECQPCQQMARAEAQSMDVVMGGTRAGAPDDSNARTAFTERTEVGGYGVVGPLDANDPASPFLGLTKDKRHVAIQFVQSSFEGVVGLLLKTRFWQDVAKLTALKSPYVLQLLDAGVYKDRVFLVFDLMDGVDLSVWLAQAPRALPEILTAFHEAGQGLKAAHAVGLVHGQFSARTVRVTTDGRLKLKDFALAVSPPQQVLDDVRAFSVALWQALEGAGDVPKAVTGVVAKGMHDDAAQRWPSIDAELRALDAAMLKRASPALVAGLVLGAVAVAGAIAWLALR